MFFNKLDFDKTEIKYNYVWTIPHQYIWMKARPILKEHPPIEKYVNGVHMCYGSNYNLSKWFCNNCHANIIKIVRKNKQIMFDYDFLNFNNLWGKKIIIKEYPHIYFINYHYGRIDKTNIKKIKTDFTNRFIFYSNKINNKYWKILEKKLYEIEKNEKLINKCIIL